MAKTKRVKRLGIKHVSKTLFTFTILIFIILSISPDNIYARRDIPDDNLALPVLFIGDRTSGSGFIYNDDKFNYFITARHVLFNNTFTKLEELPKDLQIPHQLLYRFAYDKEKRELSFSGVMSVKEKEELIKSASQNDYFKKAIEELYKNSQQLKLKNNVATLFSYKHGATTEVNELSLQILKLFNDGKIKYHPSIDVAFVKIGTKEKSGETFTIKTFDGVIKKKWAGVITIGKENIKLYKDVLESNTVYTFGYPVSVTDNPLLVTSAPLIRKGIVAGKNNEHKTIILDCPLHPGNSGGLVLEVEKVPLGEEYRAIGLVTNSIPFKKEKTEHTENSGYSIAVPMDAIMELLGF